MDPPTSLADLFARGNKYVLNMEVKRAVGGNKDESGKERNAMLKKTPDGLGDQIYLGPSSTITPNSSNLSQPYS